MEKARLETHGFSLARPDNRWLVPVPRQSAVRVIGRKGHGTWASASFTVKWIAGSGGIGQDFATPRTIPAGGGTVFINADDMEAADELEIRLVGTESGYCDLVVIVEDPDK